MKWEMSDVQCFGSHYSPPYISGDGEKTKKKGCKIFQRHVIFLGFPEAVNRQSFADLNTEVHVLENGALRQISTFNFHHLIDFSKLSMTFLVCSLHYHKWESNAHKILFRRMKIGWAFIYQKMKIGSR